MRYSVHFQHTTDEWVLFDNAYFCMIPTRFKSEDEAYTEVHNLTSSEQQSSFRESPKRKAGSQ